MTTFDPDVLSVICVGGMFTILAIAWVVGLIGKRKQKRPE